jgi:hypothetical protein
MAKAESKFIFRYLVRRFTLIDKNYSTKLRESKINWDTASASLGKHTLKVEIPPLEGEQNTENNVKTVTIEVKEPRN